MTEPLKNTTVMVVDDNTDTCDLLRIMLQEAGASVVIAQSVDAAIEAFRRRPPHALLADIRLGDSDGYALLKTVREHNIQYRGFTPAVAITGFASPEDETRAMAAGFNAYIAKPFDAAAVISTIVKIVPCPGNLAA